MVHVPNIVVGAGEDRSGLYRLPRLRPLPNRSGGDPHLRRRMARAFHIDEWRSAGIEGASPLRGRADRRQLRQRRCALFLRPRAIGLGLGGRQDIPSSEPIRERQFLLDNRRRRFRGTGGAAPFRESDRRRHDLHRQATPLRRKRLHLRQNGERHRLGLRADDGEVREPARFSNRHGARRIRPAPARARGRGISPDRLCPRERPIPRFVGKHMDRRAAGLFRERLHRWHEQHRDFVRRGVGAIRLLRDFVLD